MSESPQAKSHAWIVPIATVFVSSLCIMVVELVAGRLIARYVGSSLYTWTSVIGIVLAGIAGGNYVGGLLADRYKAREALSSLFLVASAACLVIPVLNDQAGVSTLLRGQDWALRIALHVFVVFFAPAAILGMISPIAAKLALEIGSHTGRTIGSVYSWGAVGSIVGTFLTGYFLIAKMGTVAVLFSVSGVLLAMSMFFGAQALLPWVWGGVLSACVLAGFAPWAWAEQTGLRLGFRDRVDEYVYFMDESNYSRIRVEEEVDPPGTRSMTLDYLIHAYIDWYDPDNLQYDYEKVYAGITDRAIRSLPQGRPARGLFLGGGGFVFPAWMLRHYPGSYAEVAEIDPMVTKAAFDAFGLEPHPDMQIFNLDARNHVDDLLRRMDEGEQIGRFDLVYGDAFNHYSPPFHLTTYEFNEKVKRLMSPEGAFLANVIDVYKSGKFIGAMINTFERSFPHVYAFCTTPGGPTDDETRDTFVVVGSNRLLDLSSMDYTETSAGRLRPEHLATLRRRSDNLVLRDDYAPVDNLLAPVIRLAERQ
ncbi:MAG: spermidine synthase [Bryobacterales bacterium]|nr:spermidine synthase [Acidobacteriota bacterium]MCB9384413.1 spermidine synthase [Bryobacterales bacterium]